MKKIKKIFTLLLTFAMILGMSVTAFGANGTPQESDRANVIITNLSGNPTVTLYQIAKAEYGPEDKEFEKYIWADGINPDKTGTGSYELTTSAPTADQINLIAQGLKDGSITKLNTTDISGKPAPDGTYTANVSAGVYIALITKASDDTVYNPILLTATYAGPEDPNTAGNLVGGSVDSKDNYLWGSTAVAKSTTPTVDKEIIGGITPDNNGSGDGGDGIDTAGIGDVITYQVTPTIPDYPSNAKNKTFFISDELSEGLTFDYDSLTVTLQGSNVPEVTRNGDMFNINGTTIATAARIEKDSTCIGFNLNFNYEKLVSNKDTGAVYQPVITYKAVLNEKAVVGSPGNPNDVTFYYANDPNIGETWDKQDEKPDEAAGVDKKEDSETVYTYQLAFQKTGIDTDDDGEPNPLAGAIFGIYSDKGCNKLIDKVTTNSDGYAVSTKVAKGTYYVKELAPPSGYSLNTTVYEIDAKWVTATTTVTGTVKDRTYTTESPSADAVQVGWIKGSVFYALDEVNKDTAEENDFKKAYLDSENTTTNTVSSTTTNDAGSGTALLGKKIPNTKLSTLPSTGGIGTTIFTIGGCAIMIAAAGLFFARRRKQENK